MYVKSQETLRILFVGLSIEESDFLLNQLKEHSYNSRGYQIVSYDQLVSSLDDSHNWNLLVIDQDFNDVTTNQVLKAISKRHLYIPIILLNNSKDDIPYDLLDNGVRAILAKQDKKYFANVVIKEINDFNIRKNYFLMSVALNSIEHHTRNIIIVLIVLSFILLEALFVKLMIIFFS